jgi:hypothetical protein
MSLQFLLSKKNEHTQIELLLVNRLASPVYKNLKIDLVTYEIVASANYNLS